MHEDPVFQEDIACFYSSFVSLAMDEDLVQAEPPEMSCQLLIVSQLAILPFFLFLTPLISQFPDGKILKEGAPVKNLAHSALYDVGVIPIHQVPPAMMKEVPVIPYFSLESQPLLQGHLRAAWCLIV